MDTHHNTILAQTNWNFYKYFYKFKKYAFALLTIVTVRALSDTSN